MLTSFLTRTYRMFLQDFHFPFNVVFFQYIQLTKHFQRYLSCKENIVCKPSCVLSTEIGQWCRAVVEGVAASTSGHRYIVTAIDFGSKATVDRSRMQPFPNCLLNIPAQATICTLAGL